MWMVLYMQPDGESGRAWDYIQPKPGGAPEPAPQPLKTTAGPSSCYFRQTEQVVFGTQGGFVWTEWLKIA